MKINEVISQAISGNSNAEKILFQQYAEKVFSICRRYTRNDHDAKDWMQESFILIFEKLKQFDSRKGDFGAWIHQVTKNCILGHLRKSRSRIAVSYTDSLPDYAEEPTDSILDEVKDEDLIACIRSLPDGFREILNLHVFEGLKHKEIASHLGITASTSRSQFSRAKVMLKLLIQKKSGLHYERF